MSKALILGYSTVVRSHFYFYALLVEQQNLIFSYVHRLSKSQILGHGGAMSGTASMPQRDTSVQLESGDYSYNFCSSITPAKLAGE